MVNKEEIPIVEVKKSPNNNFKSLINTSGIFILYFFIPLLFLVPPLALINIIPFVNYIVPLLLGGVYIFIQIKVYKNGDSLNFLLISLFSVLSAILRIVLTIFFCKLSMLITCDVYTVLTIPSLISMCFLQIVLWIAALLAKIAAQRLKAFDLTFIASLIIVINLVLMTPITLKRYISAQKYWDKVSEQVESVRSKKSAQDLVEKSKQHAFQMNYEFPDINQFQIIPYECANNKLNNTFQNEDRSMKFSYDKKYEIWEEGSNGVSILNKSNKIMIIKIIESSKIFVSENEAQALNSVLAEIKETHIDIVGFEPAKINRTIYKIDEQSGLQRYYLSYGDSSNQNFEGKMWALVQLKDNTYKMLTSYAFEESGNKVLKDVLCTLEIDTPIMN